MAVFGLHPRSCERAREWASLRLDGELSEFEGTLLGAHLARCSSCSAYADSIRHATETVRHTPLVVLEAPVSLPARRRVLPMRVFQIGAAAAVMVTAVGVGALLGSPSFRTEPTFGPPVHAGADVADDALVRGPRLAMINAAKGLGPQRGIGITDI